MKTTKKFLSVLLAVVMLMTSMSVCFGTVSFAAGGTATDAQWNTLAAALANDTVKGAAFTGSTNNKTVDDPDGKIIAAVEAYFDIVNTIANKAPACGNPGNDRNVTGSTEANRTINQVNTTIKNEMASRLGADYTAYNVDAFLTGLLAGANVSDGKGSQLGGRDKTNDTSAPGTNLSAISDIKITVTMANAITGYATPDELPDNVVTSKSFTVKHTNTNYDYTYSSETVEEGSGCNKENVTYYSEYYNYFYNISEVSSQNGASLSTQTIKNTASTLSTYADYFSKDLDALVAVFDITTLNAVKTAVINAKANVVDGGFGATVYNHFFSAYDADALSARIDKAVEIISAAGIAEELNAIVAAGYDDIITDKGALESLAQNVKTLADRYDAYAADVREFVESHEYEGETFVRSDVTDFYNAILCEIELIELRVLKATIATEVVPFLGYNEDNVADRTVSETELNYAKGTLKGWLDALDTYDDANVAEVWEGYDIDGYLAELNDNIEYLIIVNGYTDDFADRYAYYVSTVYANTNVADDSEELSAAVKNYDSWYTGLKTLIDEIETELGKELADKIFTELDTAMKAHLDSKYNVLHERVFAQIDLADQLYKVLDADGTLSILNIDTYSTFEDALGHVDVDLYNFLLNSPNFDMPQLTIDEFNEIWTLALEDYHSFITSGGFDRYQQTEIPDFTRAEADDTHDAHKGDFTVTDAKVEKVIDVIEKLLADEDIKALLGDLINKDKETGEPTGEPFDLAALLGGLIEENLYSDSLINTLIQFIYPAVANIFTDVWMGINPIIDDPAMDVMGQTVSVYAELHLKTVEEATAGLNLPIFPTSLATKINAEYPQFSAAAAALSKATTKATVKMDANGDPIEDTRTSPWNDDAIFTDKLDKDGNVVTDENGNTTKVLALDWGIDEAENKRERFLQAAQAALSGLEPVLLALLCNQPMNQFNGSIGTGIGTDGLNGYNAGDILFWKNVTLSDIDLDIHTIDLRLTATANDGYNNVIAPLFELLGVTAPDGETFKSVRDFVEKGLLQPLDAFITKLAANPIETILNILPNLAYAAELDFLLTKLEYLTTNISYSAGATIDASLKECSCSAGLIGTLLPLLDGVIAEMTGLTVENNIIKNVRVDDVMTDNLPVELSSIINIGDMLGGADLSNFAGIWDMIMGMLPEGVTLSAPDAAYVATLGKLTWKDTQRSAWSYTPLQAGKAAYIEANKADVLIYLVRYLLNALGSNPDLLAALGLELSEDVQNIIAGATANPDKTITALVELFNAVEYDSLKEYVWYVSELNEDTVVGMTPAIQQYLGYDNNWTKATATHLIENVDEIIDAVMAMVGGEDAEPFSLSDTLADLIGGLFTNKNITAIAKLLSKLDLNALLAGDAEEGAAEEAALDVNALLNKFTGLDLSVFAAYAELADDAAWGFEDGDKTGFVNALANLLAPLNPVLDFILVGENLTLLDEVELIGYNGYDSAIVPLLEALGAAPAALKEGDNALKVVLDTLMARVDAIVADPVDEIFGLIPSLLYFVKSNGLTTAVRNLLQPVLVILETIDPVYALNLNELIGGLTADLGFTLDLGNLSFEAIFDILGAVVALDLSELEEIIDDVCEVITPIDYTSASSIIGANGKKGAYGEFFDAADLLTVLVSFALSWVQEGSNANDIVALIAGDDAEKAAEIQKYITGAITIIGGINPEYQQINWAYNFPADYDEAIFESGLTIQPTLNTITYPTNWTEDTAKYVAENIDDIADEIIGLVDESYATIADFIADKVTIYSTENVNAIVELVAGLLEDIDEVLVKTVGIVLGADIDALRAYKAPEGIDTGAEFAAALTEILGTIKPVVDWLFFGKDYAFLSKNGADLVTIKGAEGYAYGLAPILEALGVAAPAKDEATVANVLEATFARVDAVLADPVNEALDLLPNLVYFLNANGVSVSVQNLLAGVTGLIGTVKESFGVEIDLMVIFNDLINGLLPEESTVTLDVANLDLESIFALVQELLALDLTPIADILVDLCVGNIVVYTSASGEYGFKMQYNDDFARYDMITIIVSCLLQIIKLDTNEETIKGMVGEEAYEGILNVISLDVNVPVQDFKWALTESADTGEVFSALQSSELFGKFSYGPTYTKEMEQYISDNFGEFVDNLIYLLGLDINADGKPEATLTELLGGLVGGSVYNSSMVVTVRDALAGLVGTLEESLPAGAHILEILRTAEIADLKAVAAVEVPEFTDDRNAFVSALCSVLEPIYPVLEWLLADADLTFFIDEEETTLITLPGAEGYAFGLIPVLEALDCQGILTIDEYNAAVAADRNVLLTSILTPLLDRVDEIIANPAEEILSILPNLIYFINSNGVDTVVKNTLNAVYTLLNAIEPIAKVDLYELIGLDLETLTFEKLFDMILELIAEATGYELTAIHADAIVELTTGTLESYTSANGKTAYRMVYQAAEAKGEMVTVVLRLAITFLAMEKNVDAVMGILKDSLGMSAEVEEFVRGLLTVITECLSDTKLGIDVSLSTLYYIFFGADTGVDGAVGGYNSLNAIWKDALADLRKESADAADMIEDILGWDIFEDIIDTEGIAPNGLIAFFQKIISFFQKIIEWFRSFFG